MSMREGGLCGSNSSQATMMTKRRARKHPSFRRRGVPPGPTVHRAFHSPKPRASNRGAFFRQSTDKLSWQRFLEGLMQNGPAELAARNVFRRLVSRLVRHYPERDEGELEHDVLGCLKVLDLLDEETVCEEIVHACLALCARLPWAETFLAGRFQEAKEILLRVAVEKAVTTDNFRLIYQLLPRVVEEESWLCVLLKAHEVFLEPQFCRFAVVLCRETDARPELLFSRALDGRHWPVLASLLEMWPSRSRRLLETLLLTATRCQQWEVVRLAIRQKVTSRQLNWVLCEALQWCSWETVTDCVERGAKIATACVENGFDLSRSTVLLDAVLECSFEEVRRLLQAGASPDVSDCHGETALSVAAEFRPDWRLHNLLLSYSRKAGETASAPVSSRNGRTLLHELCGRGQADLLHTLLSMRADPLVRDEKGETLMMAASDAIEGRENVYRVLIKSGVSTHQAVVSEYLLASLKERDADVDQRFHSPKRRAIECGQLRIAKMLYASGACSNREIHALSASPFTRERLDEFELRDVATFLADVSSNPRSLTDLCALKVSHLIGCGPRREDRAARAGLPPPLCRLVLQAHVIHPDFLDDLPPDPNPEPFIVQLCFSSLPRTEASRSCAIFFLRRAHAILFGDLSA